MGSRLRGLACGETNTDHGTRAPPRLPYREGLFAFGPGVARLIARSGAAIDEAPIPPEVACEPVEVDVTHMRPPGIQARPAEHERAHAVVDQLAKRVDRGRVGGLSHGCVSEPSLG